MFLSAVIKLYTIKEKAIANAVDGLEDAEKRNRLGPTGGSSDRKTYLDLRAVYKKLGRKLNLLYNQLPAEIRPALKEPAGVKKSLTENLIYREYLGRYVDEIIKNDVSCDQAVSDLIEGGFFAQGRGFETISDEVLKSQLSCSDKKIRTSLKKAVANGKLEL